MAPRVLDKKLKRVREMKTDTPSMLEALDALATFYVPKENTLDARRNLRADLESRGLRLMKEFMAEFDIVQSRLDKAKENVNNIHGVCDNLLEKLDNCSEESKKFLSVMEELKSKRDNAATKAKAMDEFLERFQLSESQLQSLSMGPRDDEDGGETFFSALEHVGEIRTESQTLLSTQFQSAGLEIFEAMAKNQNMAHRKLFDWVRVRCTQLDSDNPEPSRALYRGLRALQSVPAYYELSRECVANARRASLVRRFRVALIHGGPNGMPRPIQMHAHDPFRYIGDMLAWVHQATALEKDLVKSLFSGSDESSSHDNQVKKRDESMVDGVVPEILDRIFESMCNPLSVQVRQVIENIPSFIVVYKIANLFKFYGETMAQIIPSTSSSTATTAVEVQKDPDQDGQGNKSEVDEPVTKEGVNLNVDEKEKPNANLEPKKIPAIVNTLDLLQKDFMSLFFKLVEEQTMKLMASPPAYPQDLSVAVEVSELIRRLSELLSMYNQSLSGKSTEEVDREEEFKPVLTAFVDPLLIMCRASASGLDKTDAGVYIINNIFSLQEVMTQYDFTSAFVERLTMEIGDWMDHVVSEQADEIWKRCGMYEKISMLDKEENLSSQPGMDPASLQVAFTRFYQSMFSMVMPEFDRLNNPRLRTTARNSTARSIAMGYQKLYEALSKPESGYSSEDLEKILVHAPEQVSKYVLDA